MGINIFQLAGNDRFFSVLTAQSRELYWRVVDDLYCEIIKIKERKISVDLVNEIITDSLTSGDFESKMEPHNVRRFLLDCGWIVCEYDGVASDEFISFTPYAFNFINHAYLVKEQSDNIQADNYIQNIVTISNELKNQTSSYATKYPYRQGLLKIQRSLKDASHKLENIKQQTKDHIYEILSIKDMNELIARTRRYVDDMRDGYLADIYENFSMSAIQRFHVSQTIDFMENDADMRESLLYDMREMNMTMFGVMKSDSELSDELDGVLRDVRHELSRYKEYVDKVTSTLSEMMRRATSRMQILGAGNTSYISILEKMLDHLDQLSRCESFDQDEIEDIFSGVFNLHDTYVFDDVSFYKKREVSKQEQIDPISEPVDDGMTDEEILESIRGNYCTVDDANEYVNALLGEKDEISICDIDEFEDLIHQIIIICMFADDVASTYRIELTGEKVVKCGYEIDTFVIERVV